MATTTKSVSHQAKVISPAQSLPVVFWAWVGVFFVLLEGYIWGSWILGPNFKPTDPGPDPISSTQLLIVHLTEVASMLLGIVSGWYWILRPRIKEGRMTTDAMLALCCLFGVVWDCSMNYTSTTLLYNSYAFNRGSWTLGSYPGWISPNGNLLPEPLFLIIPGYLWLLMGEVVFMCWLLRKIRTRFPGFGVMSLIGLIVVVLTVLDNFLEGAILFTGIFAYPYGIPGLTVFAGKPYQMPLTEGLLFGGLLMGSITVLRFFTDDKGRTFVERGLDKLNLSDYSKQWVKFLALFGFIHLAFVVFFTIPNQWLATHSGPYPEGLPSYLTNNMCVYGPQHNECPGPGVDIRRP